MIVVRLSSHDREFIDNITRIYYKTVFDDLKRIEPIYAYRRIPEPGCCEFIPTDILFIICSASAFTALYKIICKYLEKHKDREISIERGNTRIIIKGYDVPELHKIMKELLPEFSQNIYQIENEKD